MHIGYSQLDSCLSKMCSVHCMMLCHPPDTNSPPPCCDNQKWFQTLTNVPWRNKPFPWNQSYLWHHEKMWLPSWGYKPQSVFPQADTEVPLWPVQWNLREETWYGGLGFLLLQLYLQQLAPNNYEPMSLVLMPLPQMWCMTGAMSKGLKSLSSGTVTSLWARWSQFHLVISTGKTEKILCILHSN